MKTEPEPDTRTVGFILWVEPFDLWRIRSTIGRMEADGMELVGVTPPGFPGPQGVSMEFQRTRPVSHTNVAYRWGWQRPKSKPGWILPVALGYFDLLKDGGNAERDGVAGSAKYERGRVARFIVPVAFLAGLLLLAIPRTWVRCFPNAAWHLFNDATVSFRGMELTLPIAWRADSPTDTTIGLFYFRGRDETVYIWLEHGSVAAGVIHPTTLVPPECPVRRRTEDMMIDGVPATAVLVEDFGACLVLDETITIPSESLLVRVAGTPPLRMRGVYLDLVQRIRFVGGPNEAASD